MAPAAGTDAAKLSVPGAALAALLACCGYADGDCDGLLFGYTARAPVPPPSFYDDDDDQARASSGPSLSISVAGHASVAQPSSLADPLGRFRSHFPDPSAAIGFFSSRRRSPLRPSMREAALARSLSKTLVVDHPLVFLLVTPSSSSGLSVHSFDYRAFLLVDSRLVPASLNVVNAGPGFREQYHAFAPESPLPSLPQQPVKQGYSIGEQKALDGMVEGFGLERVGAIVTSASGLTSEMEEMYGGMLRKLEGLARQVEQSNERVLNQEKQNSLLRKKVAGLK
ncbi:uncharacterized protein LOC102708054 isoform X2 [Oryza brachyantha]|uniref:uncharacterized protein LOC102708054 isoform X2 n=1 Tax=Oryza brachyantha TaxID=4533 RepID=UPI001ADC40C9|nr:uncharacterized protein LOC102708054 isoform X2 [Oryza brachyantha]